MSLALGALTVLAWVVAGWAPLLVLGADVAGRRWYGRLAVACTLGAAVTGLVQLLLSACGVASGALVPGALAALSLACCAWRGARGTRGAVQVARTAAVAEPQLPAWLAALILVIALVGLAAGAGTPFRSDGSKFWAPKARELSRVAASVAPSLHDPERLGVHRDYPLLVPALLAPVFAWSPPDATAGPKLALGAFLLALLGVLAVLLPRCGACGLLVLAAFAAQPLLASLDVRESAVAAGYVDGALALFLLLLVVAVDALRAGRRGARGAGVALAALAGAALASTKLEGAVEAALVFGAAFVAGPRRGVVLAAAAGALLLALPTFAIAAGVAPDEPGFSVARLADAALWQARLPLVLAGILGLLVDVSSFGLLPLLLVVLALQRPARTEASPESARRRRFAALLGAGALAFVVLSYLATNMQAERHMDTSAHRLLWQWLPAAAWLVARRHAPAAGGAADGAGEAAAGAAADTGGARVDGAGA